MGYTWRRTCSNVVIYNSILSSAFFDANGTETKVINHGTADNDCDGEIYKD